MSGCIQPAGRSLESPCLNTLRDFSCESHLLCIIVCLLFVAVVQKLLEDCTSSTCNFLLLSKTQIGLLYFSSTGTLSNLMSVKACILVIRDMLQRALRGSCKPIVNFWLIIQILLLSAQNISSYRKCTCISIYPYMSLLSNAKLKAKEKIQLAGASTFFRNRQHTRAYYTLVNNLLPLCSDSSGGIQY